MAKVLIVEDEQPLRLALVTKFEKEGFEVLQAPDGREGIKLALEQKPDVLLLDIVMPYVDGLEVLENLRKDDWGKNVPVYILTNLSGSVPITDAMQKLIKGYIVKADWKLDDIVTEVKNTLKKN